jgi:hypothetical protein
VTSGADPANELAAQLQKSWTDSTALWSAWSDAWGSMIKNRGLPAASAMLGQVADPAAWTGGLSPLVKELQEILGLPKFADLPGLDTATVPSVAPAMDLMAAAQQYLMAAAPVWTKMCQRFQAEVQEHRERGDDMDSAGAALDLWNNVLDRTLMEFNRSADFANVQQRFLNAAMRHKLEVRKLAEQAAMAVNMPTRTEMDDVYRRLHDLQREVHSLRRDLRASKRTGTKRKAAKAEQNGIHP